VKRTCDIFWTIVDNHKDISDTLFVLFNHLIESFIDAGKLIEGNVVL